MHMAIVVLSVLLTLLFGFTGTTEVFNTTTARNNAAHLGISAGLSRMMVIGVLASMAEFERELVRERTALKRQASRANGTRFGRPKKVADAGHIVTAKRMKADGHTARDIAKYLGVSRATLYWYLAQENAA